MKSASNSFTTSNGSGKHQCASNSIAIHERRRVSDFNTSILVVDLLTAIPQYSNTGRYKHLAFDCHPIDKFILGFKISFNVTDFANLINYMLSNNLI